MRILLIEDNPGDARLIEEILNEARVNFTLSVAEKLEAGLELLASQEVDVVLLDLNLPDSSGLDTIAKLQNRFSHMPIVIITSIDDEELLRQAVRLGAQDYLVKGKSDSELLRRTLIYAIERKEAEKALRQSEQTLCASESKYRTLVENIPQKIFAKDRRSVFVSCNENLARDMGIASEEIVGKTDFDFFPRELADKYRADDARIMESGQTEGIEEKYIQGGEERWIYTVKTPMRDKDGNIVGILGIFSDITERKRLEIQLVQAQKMEAVGQLAGGIAHDFNNILSVIMGYGNIMLDRIGDDAFLRDYLNEVLAAAERGANLSRRLLVFSRRQVAEMKPVDVNDIIGGLQKMVARLIGEDINLTTNLVGHKMVITADAGQIEQVLLNLASNARDAMPRGGSFTISTEYIELEDEFIKTHGYGRPGKYVLISVTDSGVGMSEAVRKKIFEPFFTTKDIGEGTGLGLSIAYGIVKQHSGYINVYSEPGKGTTFRMYLPLIEAQEKLRHEVAAVTAPKGGEETILVAEDDAALRRLSRIVLESSGYTVITAEDGEDAVTKFRENNKRIHLVVLDMIMPKMNGKEAYDEIRKIRHGVRALFASGYTMDLINKRELVEDGMAVILKPVMPQDLLRKVREALDK